MAISGGERATLALPIPTRSPPDAAMTVDSVATLIRCSVLWVAVNQRSRWPQPK